jgi:hypothetical protein
VKIREAAPDGHAEAGRVTEAAYEGLVRHPSYLEALPDGFVLMGCRKELGADSV